MRSLKVSCGVVLFALVGTLAVACGDDDSGGTPSDGGAGNEAGDTGTGAKGGNTNAGGGDSSDAGETGSMGGTGAGGEPGAGGSPGLGGETGGGGEPGATGGAGGAGGEPVDANSCENFPATVTLGPTIGLGQTGAVVCLDMCRITTNTYSDGEGACANSDTGARFFATAGVGVTYHANLQSDWVWTSASAGTINQDFPYSLDSIPEDTEVTAVITAADNTEYTVVFTFEGANQFTVTSFTET